jgi:DNA polymerase III subunit epsilon
MSAFNFRFDQTHERQAHALEASRDYRVLRRLPFIGEIWCSSSPCSDRDGVIRVAIVDSETTGLDPANSKLIEIAIVIVEICATTGRLLNIEPPRSWLEDPHEPLSDEITRLTHLTDSDLAGQQFGDEEIYSTFDDVELLVAHNARFDYPFVTQRFPALDLPWACSLHDLDWATFGLGTGGKSIGALLTESGYFITGAHRAAADTWALAVLLIMLASDGRTRLTHLIEAAKRPTHQLWAIGAPFAVKDSLKAAGYRWNQTQRAWWIEHEPERLANESAWLASLCPLIKPRVETITWFDRHAR